MGRRKRNARYSLPGSVFSVTADALGREGHLLAGAHLIASDRRDLLPADLASEVDRIMEHGEVWERHAP